MSNMFQERRDGKNTTFHQDLQKGKQIEQKYLDIIKINHPDAYSIQGYCKEWDIYIPSLNCGVEVKSDEMSQKTGNIVVEINFNGKPSALSTTKSKYWIFDTGIKTIIVKVEDLKNLVKSFKTVKFTAKGDVYQKEVYLIKQQFIESISINNI